jgi:hypothetical protein
MAEAHAFLPEALKPPSFHWVGSGPGRLAQLKETEIALVLRRLPQSCQLMVHLQLLQHGCAAIE